MAQGLELNMHQSHGLVVFFGGALGPDHEAQAVLPGVVPVCGEDSTPTWGDLGPFNWMLGVRFVILHTRGLAVALRPQSFDDARSRVARIFEDGSQAGPT